MRVTQSLLRNVQQQSNAIATVCGERRRTWGEFASRVARLAGSLQLRGLTAGDRVALLALNSDHYLELLYAVAWAGGTVVPINTRWAVPEVRYVLDDAGVVILAVDEHFQALLPEVCRGFNGTTLLMTEDHEAGSLVTTQALITANTEAPEIVRDGDDIAGIFYTGGTTGRSKGVMLTHTNHVTNSLQLAAMMRLPPEISYLHAAPMFHIADALCIYMVTAIGGRHVVMPRFEPTTVVTAIETHGITDILLVPTMIQMLLDHLDQHPSKLTSLARLYYGASPIPEATLFRLFDALPHTTLTQLYGQTEAAPMLTVLESKYHVKEGPNAGRLRAAGRAIACIELKIVDERDIEVPRGVVGEIVARGPNVMKGYWGLPEQTAATLRGGWLHTGDAATMDDEGFIFISDRLKDMIISGGENVYSTEVENALYQHPSVAQCAVIGLPDPKWGERVHAIVIAKPNSPRDAEEIMAFCRSLVADFKCPRSVEFRDEPLPLSGAGKVLKTELRKPHWGGRARNVN
ncbi:MAG: long-chain-fatty-acid--CoA ligase [Gammaproteobacteria bacterium]|nr:long-chain-fatty-acid--CoA ligase [Gammaproteobacteria bacterium]